MATLHALVEEYARLIDAALDDAFGDELLAALEQSRERIDAKAERIALVIDELKRREQALREIAAEYAARARAAAANSKRLKEYARRILDEAGIDRAGTDRAGLRLQAAPPEVEIVDPEAVPRELCEIVVKPKLAEIGRKLKAGEEIPGAKLVRGTTLRVRLGG